ncbi:hypothetical protein HZB02_04515 [Candidatus Woesearchaeota archaeon]|nr:hypothetical protein [Candidatus Woesearchaeota archaeon]
MAPVPITEKHYDTIVALLNRDIDSQQIRNIPPFNGYSWQQIAGVKAGLTRAKKSRPEKTEPNPSAHPIHQVAPLEAKVADGSSTFKWQGKMLTYESGFLVGHAIPKEDQRTIFAAYDGGRIAPQIAEDMPAYNRHDIAWLLAGRKRAINLFGAQASSPSPQESLEARVADEPNRIRITGTFRKQTLTWNGAVLQGYPGIDEATQRAFFNLYDQGDDSNSIVLKLDLPGTWQKYAFLASARTEIYHQNDIAPPRQPGKKYAWEHVYKNDL